MEPQNSQPDQPPLLAQQGSATVSGTNSRSVGAGAIAMALAVIIAVLWWLNWTSQDDMRETIAQELARRDAYIEQRLASVSTDHESLSVLRDKVKTLTAELEETRNQTAVLEVKYQDLMQTRDERLLADTEQSVTTAAQQLQLAGNVDGALTVLQAADARLAANGASRFVTLRRLLARDMERLKLSSLSDVAGTTVKLENVVAAVDTLPLAFEQRPKNLPPIVAKVPKPQKLLKADATVAVVAAPQSLGLADYVRQMAAEIWQDVHQLVRIERVDTTEQALLMPPQIYFLRENLKLRLLAARVALLQHNSHVYREELRQAQNSLTRFFDSRAASVQTASETLKQLASTSGNLELPALDETLSAIRSSKLPRSAR